MSDPNEPKNPNSELQDDELERIAGGSFPGHWGPGGAGGQVIAKQPTLDATKAKPQGLMDM